MPGSYLPVYISNSSMLFFSVLTAVKCFSCMNNDRCLKLVNIYETTDAHLYHRRLKQPFPGCSVIPAPSSKSCAVCYVKSNITIICSGDVGSLEVEYSDGKHILNTRAVCMYDTSVQPLAECVCKLTYRPTCITAQKYSGGVNPLVVNC